MQVEDFDYALFAMSSTPERFYCGKEGHLARACHNQPGLAASTLPMLAPTAAALAIPPVPWPILARRQWFSAVGGLLAQTE